MRWCTSLRHFQFGEKDVWYAPGAKVLRLDVTRELRAQGTQVVAVHAAFIDTDMARNVQAPKSTPETVVQQVLAALEEGRDEVLADEVTRNVKRGLGAEQATYMRAP